MANKSDDTYIIQGDEELEEMYSRIHFPKFPPIIETQEELDREDRADHDPTPSSGASSDDE